MRIHYDALIDRVMFGREGRTQAGATEHERHKRTDLLLVLNNWQSWLNGTLHLNIVEAGADLWSRGWSRGFRDGERASQLRIRHELGIHLPSDPPKQEAE